MSNRSRTILLFMVWSCFAVPAAVALWCSAVLAVAVWSTPDHLPHDALHTYGVGVLAAVLALGLWLRVSGPVLVELSNLPSAVDRDD